MREDGSTAPPLLLFFSIPFFRFPLALGALMFFAARPEIYYVLLVLRIIYCMEFGAIYITPAYVKYEVSIK